MSKIKIETITPVHIGTGELLNIGSDYVQVNDLLGVVDLNKLVELYGVQEFERIVPRLCNMEPINTIVTQYDFKDYSSRIIKAKYQRGNGLSTLKEQLHNGMGLPYIPGSSLKGAMRSAILASLINAGNIKTIESLNIFQERNGKITANGDIVESYFFCGEENDMSLKRKDPYTDLFKFVQVGDAYFEKNSTEALRMVNLNDREKKGFYDASKSQLVEAISSNVSAFFDLELNTEKYNFVNKNKGNGKKLKALPEALTDIPTLFEYINLHTEKLIGKEFEIWNSFKEDDNTDTVLKYINEILKILRTSMKCEKELSCILRVGHGSGWRFMTGAWPEYLNDKLKYDKLEYAARPRNERYTEYMFPKTRRIDEKCGLLGFVKLTLEE